MVDLIVAALRFCPRDMTRDAEAVILLQATVQPHTLLDTGQVCCSSMTHSNRSWHLRNLDPLPAQVPKSSCVPNQAVGCYLK